MSSTQPSGRPTRPSSGGDGPEETIIPLLFGCVLVGAGGPAVWAMVTGWLIPRLERSSNTAARGIADWWHQNWVLVAFWAVAVVGLLVWRALARRQARARQRQWKALADGLAPRMGRDWDPQKHLRIRRWRGLRPVVAMVALTVAPQVMDREWKLAVSASARDLLGRVGPIRWPKPPAGLVAWRKPPWVEIRALVTPPWWRRVAGLVVASAAWPQGDSGIDWCRRGGCGGGRGETGRRVGRVGADAATEGRRR